MAYGRWAILTDPKVWNVCQYEFCLQACVDCARMDCARMDCNKCFKCRTKGVCNKSNISWVYHGVTIIMVHQYCQYPSQYQCCIGAFWAFRSRRMHKSAPQGRLNDLRDFRDSEILDVSSCYHCYHMSRCACNMHISRCA